jgi:hypothetical protein
MNIQTPDRGADNFAPWRSVYPTDSVGKQLVYSLERPVEPLRRNALMHAIGAAGARAGMVASVALVCAHCPHRGGCQRVHR